MSEADEALPEGPSLAMRLAAIESLEFEIIRKGHKGLEIASSISTGHFYAVGVLKRTLAQAAGFRMLIDARNFQSAAGLLRMQIDSAMRMNALALVEDSKLLLDTWMDGKAINKLKSSEGSQLSDAYLRKKLSDKHPWVNGIYEDASGFVHFSGKHFFTSIAKMDEANHVVHFQISGTDPQKPESEYFEIVDAFLNATKLAGTLAIAYLYVASGSMPE